MLTKINFYFIKFLSAKTVTLFSLSLILFNHSIFPQTNYNLSQFGKDSEKFIQQPLKWDVTDWGKFGLVAASTYLLTNIDLSVKDELQKDQSYLHSAPIEIGRIWGELYPTVIIGGAFGVYGLIKDDIETKRIGFEIYQTAFYAGSITTILKLASGRAKPFIDKGANKFKLFSVWNDDYHSLPSGHTTIAFALSTILSKNVKPLYLKILVYAPAILTAFSRVYQNKHWTSDVFLGAAIGYFVGDWVHHKHEEKESAVSFFQNPTSLISIRF